MGKMNMLDFKDKLKIYEYLKERNISTDPKMYRYKDGLTDVSAAARISKIHNIKVNVNNVRGVRMSSFGPIQAADGKQKSAKHNDKRFDEMQHQFVVMQREINKLSKHVEAVEEKLKAFDQLKELIN